MKPSPRAGGAIKWEDVPLGAVAFGASAMTVETGLWRSSRPSLDLSKCVSCLKCWVQCPDASILTDGEAKVIGVNNFFCKGCGVCAEVCPAGAITMHPESDYIGAEKNSGGCGQNPGNVGEFIG